MCMYRCIGVYRYIGVYIGVYRCIYICVYVGVYMCICVYIGVYVYVYVWRGGAVGTHRHKHAQSYRYV
jgi:hypothetical protein